MESILLIDIKSQGREVSSNTNAPDVSRTVGWVASVFPVLFDIRNSQSPTDELRKIKVQLEQVPNKGIGYGLLRYMRSEPKINTALSELPQACVCLNYLGHINSKSSEDNRFKLDRSIVFDSHGGKGHHPHLIDVKSGIYDGRLKVEVRYSENIFHTKDIDRMLEVYIEAIYSMWQDAGNNSFVAK